MIIRKMIGLDVDEVRNLINANFPTSIRRESLKATLHSDKSHTYVGIVDGEIVVTAGIRDNTRLVWIASKYKRHGHATAILQEILASMDYAYLKVKMANYSAINLYSSLGFQIKGQEKESYIMERRGN